LSQKLILPINKAVVKTGFKNSAYKAYYGYYLYGVELLEQNGNKTVWGSGNGTVVATGYDYVMGNTVIIKYLDCVMRDGTVRGVIQRLYHLATINVSVNQSITKDTIIGTYGNTGSGAGGTQLHMEFDKDLNYPLYTPILSAHSNFLMAGIDTVINPNNVMYVKSSAPDNQAISGLSSSNYWVNADITLTNYSTSTPPPSSNGIIQRLILPINKAVITTGYKNASYQSQYGKIHYGMDMVEQNGTKTVWGSGTGVVVATGYDNVLGNSIVVKYYDCEMKDGSRRGIVQRIYHLATINVSVNQQITKDTQLGTYGNTGLSVGSAHLHIEFDTDMDYPMYTPTLSANSNLFLAGTDSMLSPAYVLSIKESSPDFQSASGSSSSSHWTSSDIAFDTIDPSNNGGGTPPVNPPSNPSGPQQQLILPINKAVISAGFKNANYAAIQGYAHFGMDMVEQNGNTTIWGCGNGTVYKTGYDNALGFVVVVKYENCLLKDGSVMGLVQRIYHLDTITVSEGQNITKDTQLGFYGNTGPSSYGAHLHIEFDTDMDYPLYSPTLGGNSNIILAGTDSVLNPTNVLHIKTTAPDYQSVSGLVGYTTWTNSDLNFATYDANSNYNGPGVGPNGPASTSDLPIRKNLVSSSKYSLKCPYSMTPVYITVHNTATDASASNEISYMISNSLEKSYHYAVDDQEAIQGLPLDRNGWHAGDTNIGTGNRQSIGIEICYSASGGNRFIQAEKNATKLIAKLMHQFNIPLSNVRTHQSWDNKYCPHRTLDMGWQRFLDMVNNYYVSAPPSTPQYVTHTQISQLGWKNVSQEMLDDLNRTLDFYNITTKNRICHFLSQASHESECGYYTQEIASGWAYEGRQDLGNIYTGDGPKFKGAGYIQITGRYNYTACSVAMNDSRIVDVGCPYVAENYPWVASGFWWDMNNMNALCDTNPTVAQVTLRVNGTLNTLAPRQAYYNLAITIF